MDVGRLEYWLRGIGWEMLVLIQEALGEREFVGVSRCLFAALV